MPDIRAVYNTLSAEEVELMLRMYIADVFDCEDKLTMVSFMLQKSREGMWTAYCSINAYETEAIKTEILASVPNENKRRRAYVMESSLRKITLEKTEYGEQDADKIPF